MRLFTQKRLIHFCKNTFAPTGAALALALIATGCRRQVPLQHFDREDLNFTRRWQTKALRRPGPVFIDPGHGGKDVGAVSSKGQCEKRLNLMTAFSLQTAIAKQRMATKLSRSVDQELPLDRRAQVANAANALLLISLHHNWASNNRASGIEIFYPREEFGKERSRLSRALANSILLELTTHGFLTTRGVKASGFRVLIRASMPAVLIEGGFLSNEWESRQLEIPARRKSMALCIARGIDRFLKEIYALPTGILESSESIKKVKSNAKLGNTLPIKQVPPSQIANNRVVTKVS